MARKPPPEDDDVPAPRGKITVPAKKVTNRKRKPVVPKKSATVYKMPNANQARRRARSTDDEIDEMEDGGPAPTAPPQVNFPPPEMDGLPQDSQRSLELAAQMQARLSNEPIFPYPPELSNDLKPYWVELVNSFPLNHFQVSDITMMKMYCQCAYDIERQNVMIASEGEVVLGARAAIVNPRVKVRESNRATLLALATKFRNQPASRMNTDNFKRKRQRAQDAAQGAEAVTGDEDGLLAGGADMEDDELLAGGDEFPQTRH